MLQSIAKGILRGILICFCGSLLEGPLLPEGGGAPVPIRILHYGLSYTRKVGTLREAPAFTRLTP